MNDRRDAVPAGTIYVLDTSSIRAISYGDLHIASSRAHLAVSPISIFELLCNLDKQNNREHGAGASDWLRLHKANLSKCSLLSILDDPFAAQADAVGARALVNPTRFEDRLVLPQLFPALASCPTLDDFYSFQVRYPTGEIGSVRDAAERARALLDSEETSYKAHVNKWCGLVLAEFGYERSQKLTPVEFVRLAGHAASSLARHYEDGLQAAGVIVPNLGGPVFSAIYAYVGYGIARALEYLRRASGCIESLNVDPNDMEDSAICLHLDLVSRRVLVTGDGGTYRAVSRALETLRAASETLQQPLVVFTSVLSTEEFKRHVLSTSG